ncbi:MAG: hypothetical protein EPN20_13220, partial [Magnetospirillum sp.]
MIAVPCVVALAGVPLSAPYAETPTDRDKVVEELKDFAHRHVEVGTPMNAKDVIVLYPDPVPALTRREMTVIYEQEYQRQAKMKTDWWRRYLPEDTAAAAGGGGALVVVIGLLVKFLGPRLGLLGRWLKER